jgi:hypothetical protein
MISLTTNTTLQKVIANRDRYNEEQRWSPTAISFASTIHPPNDASDWAAARRTLIVYDWLEHGQNRANMQPVGSIQRTVAGQCKHCLLPDLQAHCELYTPIQEEARIDQYKVAKQLLDDTKCDRMQHFIEMLFHASWVDSPQTTRL